MKLYRTFIPMSELGAKTYGMDGVAGLVLADDRADAIAQLKEHAKECEGFEQGTDLAFSKARSSQANMSNTSTDEACSFCLRNLRTVFDS